MTHLYLSPLLVAERSAPERVPTLTSDLSIPAIHGPGALMKFAYQGGDVDQVFKFYADQVFDHPNDAAALLDLALLHLISQRRTEAYTTQARALALSPLYRLIGKQSPGNPPQLRVLALVAPGDFMNNAPLDFILNSSSIGLDLLYVLPNQPLPEAVPEHDVLFCAVNESDENRPVLRRLARLLPYWPRPVLNAPAQVAQLSREALAARFAGSAHIYFPPARRVSRADLLAWANGRQELGALLPGAELPILLRPVGSHCGENLEKIAGPAALAGYLKHVSASEFIVAAFADYLNADGLFRKYRIMLIQGVPFLCHLALTTEWKIHYKNAGMAEDAEKRAAEATAMATFETDFAQRHQAAFAELSSKIGLDYFGIDAAEMPDGRLLIFEAETAMVIHDMDAPDLYPYKVKPMATVFAAFGEMITQAANRPSGLSQQGNFAS